MNTKNLSTLKIHKLTQAQYERELAAGRIDEDALYLTPDDGYSRDDLDVILAGKADVGHTHSISNIDNLQETLDGHDIAIDELNEEVSIDYSQIAFDTGSEYEDGGIDFSVYQTKADGTLSTTAKNVSGAINELDAGIDNEAALRTEADTALDAKIAQISNPNLLINGDFQVWQRGTSFNNVANQYVVDRWKLANAKANTTLVERSTDVPSGQPFNYSIHIKEDTNGNSYLVQHFETPLKGVVTLSLWYKSTTGISIYITDAGQDLHLSHIPASNVWTKITKTFEVTSLQSIEIIHYLSIGECYITGIKLEQGSIATPFVPRPYAEELAICQRYFRRYNNEMICTVALGSANSYVAVLPLMRTNPTVTEYGNNLGVSIWTSNGYVDYSVDSVNTHSKSPALNCISMSIVCTGISISHTCGTLYGDCTMDAEIY